MILLDGTTVTLEMLLAGAVSTAQPKCDLSMVELRVSDQTINANIEQQTAANGVTAVTIAAAPTAGFIRIIKSFTIFNYDTAVAVVTVRINKGGTTTNKYTASLDANGGFCEYSADD